jgi:hypothetical protein
MEVWLNQHIPELGPVRIQQCLPAQSRGHINIMVNHSMNHEALPTLNCIPKNRMPVMIANIDVHPASDKKLVGFAACRSA